MSEQLPNPKPADGTYLPVKKAIMHEPQSAVLAPSYLAEMGFVGLVKPFKTDIDSTDPTQRALLRKCKHHNSESISDRMNTTFLVQNWFITPIQVTDEQTGEQKVYARTVLVLDDGSLVGSGSQGIAQCIFDYAATERQAPWVPPIKVTPKSKPLANGKHWYYLEIDDIQPAVKHQATGKKTG